MRPNRPALGLWLGFSAVVALAAPSRWETRGDQLMRQEAFQRAVMAYETALAEDPGSADLRSKYQRAFLRAFESRRVEAEAGKTGKIEAVNRLNRMGARRPVPAEVDGADADLEAPGATPDPGPDTPGAGTAPESAVPPEAATAEAGEGDPAAGDGEGEAGPPKSGRITPLPEDYDEGSKLLKLAPDGTVSLVPSGARSRLRPSSRSVARNRMGARRRGIRGNRAGDEPGDEPGAEDAPEEEGPKRYGGGEAVEPTYEVQGFEGSQGEEVEPEDTVIQTTKYRIENIQVSYRGNDMLVKGEITNISPKNISLPRVYCSIFDKTGLLRGRNFSYIRPGKNVFPRGRKRRFEVKFKGYSDPLGKYQFEVIP